MTRSLLESLFHRAVAQAQPALAVERHLPAPPKGRTVVIGAGKASAQMARAFEQAWPGEISGLVVTRYGYAEACQRIEIVEAAHPVPDAAGQKAAARLMEMVSGLTEDDLVVASTATGAELAFAADVVGWVADRFGAPPLYARVDMVVGDDGNPVLMELEAVEPYLYLAESPGALDRVVDAILRRVT